MPWTTAEHLGNYGFIKYMDTMFPSLLNSDDIEINEIIRRLEQNY